MFDADVYLNSGDTFTIVNVDAKSKDDLLDNMRYGRIITYTDVYEMDWIINSKMIEYIKFTPVEKED